MKAQKQRDKRAARRRWRYSPPGAAPPPRSAPAARPSTPTRPPTAGESSGRGRSSSGRSASSSARPRATPNSANKESSSASSPVSSLASPASSAPAPARAPLPPRGCAPSLPSGGSLTGLGACAGAARPPGSAAAWRSSPLPPPPSLPARLRVRAPCGSPAAGLSRPARVLGRGARARRDQPLLRNRCEALLSSRGRPAGLPQQARGREVAEVRLPGLWLACARARHRQTRRITRRLVYPS